MFYQSIANVYDYIFPQNRKQIELIDRISKVKETDTILDIGCATGNLTSLIYEKTVNVTGIDLDEDLLKIAKSKYPHMNFKKGNMLFLIDSFEKNSIDKIISFGNTLVHLPNKSDVRNYFKQVYDLLKENGDFIVQIINYDRIINMDVHNLPTIDTDKITFVRDYILRKDYVDFNTKLVIKENGQVIKNSIPLLTLTHNNIKGYLEEIGFKDINFYGDLDGREIQADSVPLIFSAKK